MEKKEVIELRQKLISILENILDYINKKQPSLSDEIPQITYLTSMK